VKLVVNNSFLSLVCLLKSLDGQAKEYLLIDSTPIPVSHTRREKKASCFKRISCQKQNFYRAVYGFKLHMIFNALGQIVNLMITTESKNDRSLSDKWFKA
jgi:hypothetical protein